MIWSSLRQSQLFRGLLMRRQSCPSQSSRRPQSTSRECGDILQCAQIRRKAGPGSVRPSGSQSQTSHGVLLVIGMSVWRLLCTFEPLLAPDLYSWIPAYRWKSIKYTSHYKSILKLSSRPHTAQNAQLDKLWRGRNRHKNPDQPCSLA